MLSACEVMVGYHFRYAAPVSARTAIGLVSQQARLAVDPRSTLRQVIAEPLGATRRTGQEVNAVLYY